MDGAAVGVPEHDHQARAEGLGGELDAADLGGRDDVAGHADHEQVPEPLVEDELRRHARVRAAEHDRERLLLRGEGAAARGAVAVVAALLADEAQVALAQRRSASRAGNHGSASRSREVKMRREYNRSAAQGALSAGGARRAWAAPSSGFSGQ